MDIEKLKKDKRIEYRKYISDHIDNVNQAWNNMKNKDECIAILRSEGIYNLSVQSFIDNHDLSKFSDEEFEPYRRSYFSIDEKEKEDAKVDLEIAWRHHYDNNQHHWDYWHLRNMVNDMPLVLVVEMACDHIAMSMKFGGTALQWFKDNEKDIHLGDRQKEFYLKLLNAYYK